jgi:signal recognition particle subunit SRP54
MFEELSNKFEDALKTLRGEDKITEQNVQTALKVVRRALIEADVNLSVANEFLQEVKKEAIGAEVIRGVKPEQKFIDIVHKKLTEIMGDANAPLTNKDEIPSIIMLVGLQGAGKTTAAAKLGLFLKEKGKRILIIAADTFRPAAKDQLEKLGRQIDVDVYRGLDTDNSLEIVREGVRKCKESGYDIVIVDTAGRLYIDEKMMEEASQIKKSISPNEVLLVVDSMIGQEAADLTKAFDNKIGITGAILTKLDGDSRGGAALSIKKVSGKPIKFIGTGEKVEALEPFFPDRLASRILGMGDILTLVDKAQKEIEIGDVLTMQKKFEEASFDFSDFVQQMKLIKRMGSLGGLMKLIPGMNKIDQSTLKSGEQQLTKIQSMISSMTNEEKKKPELLSKNHKRKRRIANGSGHTVNEVEKMIADFERMRGMMQNVARGNLGQLQNSFMNTGKVATSGQTFRPEQEIEKKMRGNISKKKKGFFDL